MRRQKKTFSRPSQKWDKSRIRMESQLLSSYGLKNKSELWKAKGVVKTFRSRARRLFNQETGREELFGRLHKLGIFTKEDATLDDVLGLDVENVLERRLQTLVFRKGLAGTPKQARQLITHRHVSVGGHVVDAPGYMVTVEEEKTISYSNNSPLTDKDHPLRSPPKVEGPKEEVKGKPKEEAKEEPKEKPKEAKPEVKAKEKPEAKAKEELKEEVKPNKREGEKEKKEKGEETEGEK